MTTLTATWWAVALRGLCAVVFGVMAFFWPASVLAALGMLFGIYMLADGILALIYAVRGAERHTRHWKLLLGEGIVGAGVGIVAISWPQITALAAVYLIAFWALATGVLQLFAGLELRHILVNDWLLALCGGVSLACGLLLLVFPLLGALAILWFLGAYALVTGALLLSLAWRLLDRQKRDHRSNHAHSA